MEINKLIAWKKKIYFNSFKKIFSSTFYKSILSWVLNFFNFVFLRRNVKILILSNIMGHNNSWCTNISIQAVNLKDALCFITDHTMDIDITKHLRSVTIVLFSLLFYFVLKNRRKKHSKTKCGVNFSAVRTKLFWNCSTLISYKYILR